MSDSIAFLNGDYLPLNEAKISVLDRGFLFADGIYEVIPVYQGKVFRLEQHLDRLEFSLAETRIDTPVTRAELTEIINNLVTKNGAGNLSIYLQITRGTAPIRNHAFPDESPTPTLFLMCSPISTPAASNIETTKGYKAITATDIRWVRCDIKSVSLLPNILLRQQAEEQGAAEAILLRDGIVTEGSASNLFLVTAGKILTPPKSHHILGGITRDLIIELAHENDLPLEETEISEAQLRSADEIWCSSSTKEIIPIVQLDDAPVGQGFVGEVWKQVANIYNAFKLSLING